MYFNQGMGKLQLKKGNIEKNLQFYPLPANVIS